MLSSVADRMKLSKADILNPESDNAAVKLALAETHVIQETKKYLEEVNPTHCPSTHSPDSLLFMF